MDSSGIAVISTTAVDLEVHKLPLPGSYFITDRFAKAQMTAAAKPLTVSICHTRSATSGGISLNNAHPFLIQEDTEKFYREMVGVHNGTLQAWHAKPNARDYVVDSEWALNHVFAKGLQAFTDFEGAYCFVWWDSLEDDTLMIARNDQRPMHVAFLENGGMAYASEPGMLFWLLERNGLTMEGKLLSLTAGYAYKFVAGKCKEFTKELLPVKPVVVVPNYHGSSVRTYTTYYDTTVDKLNALFRPMVPASNVSPTTGTPGLRPSVTPSEVVEARRLQLQGERGTFTPENYDQATGELEGTLFAMNAELKGIIRNAHGWEHSWEEAFDLECTIIGVKSEGAGITLVLSKPKLPALVIPDVIEGEVVA